MNDNVRRFRRVDTTRPCIGDLCFDDLHRMPLAQQNLLCARGVVWGTAFEHEDDNGVAVFGGHIIASSLEEAERIAERRGLGERVGDQVVEIVPWGTG